MTDEIKITITGKDISGVKVLKNVNKEMDKTTKKSGRMSKALGGLGKVVKVGLVGGLGLAAAGIAGLAVGMGKGIKNAMTLEQTIADTAAVMGKSADEVAPLKSLIEDLGIDPTLKVTAGEARQAINMLARNGLNMDQIMQGAAKSTVLLANATGVDFGTAADIATDTMALFGIEASNMSEAVNGITSVVNNSKFGIDDYKLALAQGGGVAATVGVNFKDFNTSIAAISPLFASGSDAGTSFKVMLQGLPGKSGPAVDAMKELGLITEDGSNKFFDAQGNMKGMGEIAGILQSSLSGLSDEQKTQALSTIFGTDAMRAAAGMAAVGEEGFAKLQSTMGKTDAAESATTRMDTLTGSLDILSGIVDALFTKMGGALVPALRLLSDWASAFLSTHSEKITTFFESFGRNLEALVGWVIAVVEDGDTMNDWLTKMNPNLASTITFLVDVVSGIASLAKTMAGAMFEISSFVLGTGTEFENLGKLFDELKKLVSDGFEAIINWVSNSWPTWKEKLGEWGGAIWQWVVDAAPIALTKLGEWGGAIWQWVTDNLPAWQAELGKWGEAIWQWIVDSMPTVNQKLGEWGGSVWQWVSSNATELGGKFGTWVSEMWQWIINSLPGALERLTNWVSGISDWISSPETINKISSSIEGWIGGLLSWAQGASEQSDGKMGEVLESLIRAIGGITFALGKAALALGWAIVKGMMDGITGGSFSEGLDKLREKAGELIDKFGEGFSKEGIQNKAAQALVGIVVAGDQKFNEYFPHFRAQALRLTSEIGEGFSKNGLKGAAQAAMTGLSERFNFDMGLFKTHVGVKAGELITAMANAFSYEAMWDMGKNAIDGLVGAINSMWGTVTDTIGGLGQSMLDKMNSVLGNNSPSKEFFNIMGDVEAGILKRINMMSPEVAIGSVGENLIGGFQAGLQPAAAGATDNSTRTVSQTFNVTLSTTGSEEDIETNLFNLAKRYEAGIG